MFQNLNDAAPTDITNYRIFMGFKDDTYTTATTYKAMIQVRSTTSMTKKSTKFAT